MTETTTEEEVVVVIGGFSLVAVPVPLGPRGTEFEPCLAAGAVGTTLAEEDEEEEGPRGAVGEGRRDRGPVGFWLEIPVVVVVVVEEGSEVEDEEG